ncbi:Hypothetical protein D9617_15g041710 [Elsinoe fawcettii]|nr:Hypothetical protein D9617_15g041710 [Elsinoe fawcettii]
MPLAVEPRPVMATATPAYSPASNIAPNIAVPRFSYNGSVLARLIDVNKEATTASICPAAEDGTSCRTDDNYLVVYASSSLIVRSSDSSSVLRVTCALPGPACGAELSITSGQSCRETSFSYTLPTGSGMEAKVTWVDDAAAQGLGEKAQVMTGVTSSSAVVGGAER